MKTLQDVLYKVRLVSVKGNVNIPVKAIHIDSRKITEGAVFVALRGLQQDGHMFIQRSVEKKAAAIVCETLPQILSDEVTYIQVSDSHEAVAYMAHNFYDEPSNKTKLVGITGTNGKTTIATLLYKLFTSLGYTCGLISTVQNHVGSKVLPSEYTTPDAVKLNALLYEMVESNCTYVFMECSSHAIHQHRITGLHFSGGVFSNITHDHLDYHKTFDEYIRVKKSFFDKLPGDSFALSNLDDKRGVVMLQNTHARKFYYSLKQPADYKGKIIENTLLGLVMQINETEVHCRMIGEFNAYNLLAAYGTAICLGEQSEEVLRLLSLLSGAEGRFEYIVSNNKIIGIIDYAHTPDALENVLSTIKKLRRGHEQVITVVGCGGDRDRQKRPVMAQVAAEHSTKLILTSDNPRNEEPNEIIAEMQSGLNSSGRRKTIAITERKEAIKMAINYANKEDIILVAGKGHEKYQEIKGVKYPFDDKEVLKEMFLLLGK